MEEPTTPVEEREPIEGHEADQPLELHIVSKDGVNAMAWQVADERIADRTQRTINLDNLPEVDQDANFAKKGWQRIKRVATVASRSVGHAITNPTETWHQVWTGNIGREHVRRQEHDNAIREMREARGGVGSIMAPKGVSEAAAQAEDQALISRFSHELDRAVLHHGEQKTNISERAEYRAVEQEIKGLVRELVAGNFADDASFIEARNRVLERVSREHPEIVAEGMMYAENLRQVADRVKLAADETGTSTDRLVEDMKVYVDIARTGVRGEIQHDRLERVAGFMRGRSTDLLVNEGTVATAASIAMTVGKVFGRKLVSSGLRIGTVGAGAAVWAAGRERRMFHQEYRQHSRQAAMGETFEGTRRAEIEQSRIETVSANNLTDTLNGIIFNNGNPTEGIRTDVDQDSFNMALLALSQARTATNASDVYNMDLLSYTSAETVESERLALDIAIAEAQVALDRIAAANPDLEVNIGNGTTTVENAVTGLHLLIAQDMGTDIESKVDTFKDLRRMRALKAARNAAIFGVAIGTVVEEISSLVNPAQQGLIESAIGVNKGATSESLLNGIIDNPFAHHSHSGSGEYLNADELARFDKLHDQSTGWITQTKGLPEGYKFEIDSEHHVMNLVDHKGHTVIENIDVDESRRFTDAGIAQLEAAGIKVNKDIVTFDTTETTTRIVSDADFVHNHPDLVTNVHRNLWYGNDTPAPIFDHNELRAHWGAGGTGVDAEGYKLSMAAMTEHGSWQGDQMAAAHALAAEGKLKYFLSASDGTQSTPFVFDINPANGEIVIPHDHPAAALFGVDQNGHAFLKGRFGEVAEVRGVNQYGVTEIRPLATHVGGGMPSVEDTITTGGKIDGAIYNLEFETPEAIPIPTGGGLPPDGIFMPFVPRAGLENKRGQSVPPEVNPAYYGAETPETYVQWLAANPELIQTRKKIKTADDKYIWVEQDGSPVERDLDREREVVSKYIDDIRKTDPEYFKYLEDLLKDSKLPEMKLNTRVAINIPAHLEEAAIYNALEQYVGQQDSGGNELDPSIYEINVIVNRAVGTTADGTVAEIERFKSEQAAAGKNWQINIVDVEFPKSKANVGQARKVITDLTLLRSLIRPSQAGPLYIESEDADLVRVSKRTVSNLIKKLDNEPHLDAVQGIQDRDPKTMMKNDMLFLRRRMDDFMLLMMRNGRMGTPETNPNWNWFNDMFTRMYTSGWNMGFTAEGYALIGGYTPKTSGEDLVIGEKLSWIRGDGSKPNNSVIGRVATRTDSSPRRFIIEVLTGKPAYNEGAFEDPAINAEIREKTTDELLGKISKYERITDSNQGDFGNMVQGFYRMIRNSSPSTNDAHEIFGRIMLFAGFKKDDYHYAPPEPGQDGEQIVVTDWSNVKSALEDYRARRSTS